MTTKIAICSGLRIWKEVIKLPSHLYPVLPLSPLQCKFHALLNVLDMLNKSTMYTFIPLLHYVNYPLGQRHHQYDSMAYPLILDRMIVFKKASLQHIAEASESETDYLVPHREIMQKEALYIYLDYYKNLLCNLELSVHCNIEHATESMLKIFWLLSNTLVGATVEKFRGTWRSTWPCAELQTVSMLILWSEKHLAA